MDLIEKAKAWLEQDPDPKTSTELEAIIAAGDSAELESRFASRLQFGTAGLRGELGAGPNRMNRIVVAQAALAIAEFLKRNRETYLNPEGNLSVVIGYDGRENSNVFALDTARIFAGAGLHALLFDRPVPTPVAAFTGASQGASATIVVTASHNPPRDNGYKVYLGGPGFGSQLIPPQDSEIAAIIEEVAASLSFAQIPQNSDFDQIGDAEIRKYIDRAKTLIPAENSARKSIRITHTALHGVGWPVVQTLFTELGFDISPTVEQLDPDSRFPTVSFPNPEEKGAMDLSIASAEKHGSDLILANDPDADRLAVAVREQDGYRMLTGDQVGLILAHEIASGADAGNLANSIVSADIAAVAERFGLGYEQTLTGFKWISKVPKLIFGYEEALGYCVDPNHTPDKDGITAALLIAEIAANVAASGLTLAEHLSQLQLSYGEIATSQVSIRVAELSIIGKVMSGVRNNPPKEFMGEKLHFTDLKNSDHLRTDAVVLESSRARLIFRPSGTEPKLKCYLQLRGAAAELARLEEFASELISSYQ